MSSPVMLQDNSPLDDSFELPKNRKLVKKDPIWLARYTVARDRKSGDRKPGDKQAQVTRILLKN